jgi:hypothetical protein
MLKGCGYREMAFEFCISQSNLALARASEIGGRDFLGHSTLGSTGFLEVVSMGGRSFEHCDVLARVELPDTLPALRNLSSPCLPLSSIELKSPETAGPDVFGNSSSISPVSWKRRAALRLRHAQKRACEWLSRYPRE